MVNTAREDIVRKRVRRENSTKQRREGKAKSREHCKEDLTTLHHFACDLVPQNHVPTRERGAP
jgi:hypothetical protein